MFPSFFLSSGRGAEKVFSGSLSPFVSILPVRHGLVRKRCPFEEGRFRFRPKRLSRLVGKVCVEGRPAEAAIGPLFGHRVGVHGPAFDLKPRGAGSFVRKE